MIYCSLEEAWGVKCINKFNEPKKIKSEKKDRVIEPFSELDTISSTSSMDCDKKLDKIYNLLNKCPKCQKKIYKKLYKKFGNSNKLIENLTCILNNNNEIIVIILLGICILICINLIKSIINF